MKTLKLIIINLLFANIGISQNLVPNGDFEIYLACPSGIASVNNLDNVFYWTNPSIAATPDYFHACSITTNSGVPLNNSGYQLAYSGDAYCGIFAGAPLPYNSSNYREYLSILLISPLVAGECYYFQMYVSLANHSGNSTDDLGAYFSSTFISGEPTSEPLEFTPQVSNLQGVYLDDTLNWTLISGSFIASGGEQQLIIGNFKDDSTTTFNPVPPSLFQQVYAYYYIDSVSLIHLPPCNPTNNASPSGLELFSYQISGNELLIKSTDHGVSILNIYNINAQIVSRFVFQNNLSISTNVFSSGYYIIEFQSHDNIYMRKKIYIE